MPTRSGRLAFRFFQARSRPIRPFRAVPARWACHWRWVRCRSRPAIWYLGDADGVVVVPGERIGEITEALEEVAAKEAELQARIESGSFDTLLNDELRRSIRYID